MHQRSVRSTAPKSANPVLRRRGPPRALAWRFPHVSRSRTTAYASSGPAVPDDLPHSGRCDPHRARRHGSAPGGAEVRNGAGQVLTSAAVSWSSLNESVALVDAGRVTGSCFSPDGRVLFFNVQGSLVVGGSRASHTYAPWALGGRAVVGCPALCHRRGDRSTSCATTPVAVSERQAYVQGHPSARRSPQSARRSPSAPRRTLRATAPRCLLCVHSVDPPFPAPYLNGASAALAPGAPGS